MIKRFYHSCRLRWRFVISALRVLRLSVRVYCRGLLGVLYWLWSHKGGIAELCMVLWILFEKCFYVTCRTWGHLENRTFSCPLQVFDINSSRSDLPPPLPPPLPYTKKNKLTLRLIHGSGKSRIRIGQWYGAFKWLSPSPTQNYRETPS